MFTFWIFLAAHVIVRPRAASLRVGFRVGEFSQLEICFFDISWFWSSLAWSQNCGHSFPPMRLFRAH